jgi:hypothetical protein
MGEAGMPPMLGEDMDLRRGSAGVPRRSFSAEPVVSPPRDVDRAPRDSLDALREVADEVLFEPERAVESGAATEKVARVPAGVCVGTAMALGAVTGGEEMGSVCTARAGGRSADTTGATGDSGAPEASSPLPM